MGSLLSILGHIYDIVRKNWSFFWGFLMVLLGREPASHAATWWSLRLLFLDWQELCALFPILTWMLHKTQANDHLYLLLLNFVHHFIDVESFLNLSHQLSRHACIKYFRCLRCCAGLLSVCLPEVVWVRPWETSLWQQCPCWAERIGEPRSNYRASCVLAGAATHHNMCVCVWETCIPLGICASIGEMRRRTNVIFSLGKHTAGMCLCMHVSDCTFGRVICHSAGGWSGKAIDCKLTGEVLSDTNHFYMR